MSEHCTNAEHSPLPWLLDPKVPTHVVAADGRRGICSTGGYQDNRMSSEALTAENEGNAALIVAAVNDHAALRAQLQQAEERNIAQARALEQWEQRYSEHTGLLEESLRKAKHRADVTEVRAHNAHQLYLAEQEHAQHWAREHTKAEEQRDELRGSLGSISVIAQRGMAKAMPGDECYMAFASIALQARQAYDRDVRVSSRKAQG